MIVSCVFTLKVDDLSPPCPSCQNTLTDWTLTQRNTTNEQHYLQQIVILLISSKLLFYI